MTERYNYYVVVKGEFPPLKPDIEFYSQLNQGITGHYGEDFVRTMFEVPQSHAESPSFPSFFSLLFLWYLLIYSLFAESLAARVGFNYGY